MTDKVNIEINGRSVAATPGETVIQVADREGIPIPRFCYHEKLSLSANCRMCLVEVEGAPKPLPACATPVNEGMKVFTDSPRAISAQKNTMEFLLINHPLDCPICDQGGECELQDVAMGYGSDVSRYSESKRVVPDPDLGPLVATDMTRCIHCTRCVRFSEEIAGIREMGGTGRNESLRIGTYVEHTLTSEMAGNLVDVCPVGALTSKPFRFRARAWELMQFPSVAPHDSVGSNLYVHTHNGKVVRVVPRTNEAINEVWISDRDRFSCEGLYSGDRLRVPMIRDQDGWQETDWDTALQQAAKVLKEAGDTLGTLVSPSATLEEMALAAKLTRGLGSNSIDHRLRQVDFRGQDSAPAFPALGMSVQDLEAQEAVLLVGSNVRKEQPIFAHRLRKAALKGGAVMFINPIDFDFHFPVSHETVVEPSAMVAALAGVVKALAGSGSAPAAVKDLVADVQADETQQAMAEALRGAGKASVLLGGLAAGHANLTELRVLAQAAAELSGASFGYLAEGANSAGAWIAGAVPHRGAAGAAVGQPGRNAGEMLAGGQGGRLLVGVEPRYDTVAGDAAVQALQQCSGVVALTAYASEDLKECAQVMLPITPFTETSGTFVNAAGQWQSFGGVVRPLGEARPGWKVLRVLGNLLNLDGFDYMSSEEVRDELRAGMEDMQVSAPAAEAMDLKLPASRGGIERVADVPIHAVDALVRRSTPLQETPDAPEAAVRLSMAQAEESGLADARRARVRQGDAEVVLPVKIDDRVPAGCVWISAALAGTTALGGACGDVELERA